MLSFRCWKSRVLGAQCHGPSIESSANARRGQVTNSGLSTQGAPTTVLSQFHTAERAPRGELHQPAWCLNSPDALPFADKSLQRSGQIQSSTHENPTLALARPHG